MTEQGGMVGMVQAERIEDFDWISLKKKLL